MSKKNSCSSGKNIKLDDAFIQTRDVAAMMVCQKMYPDTLWLEEFSSDDHAKADLKNAKAIVSNGHPYEDITDAVVSEILALTHVDDKYEIVPWREAVLAVLIKDFLASLRSSSAVLCDDAILRVTNRLGESYRGSTKNATQIITGQRTRMRKLMRALVLAILYERNYRKERLLADLVSDMESLIRVVHDDDFFLDTFPLEAFGDEKGVLNARGRFVLNEARKFVTLLSSHLEELDAMIQKSSKNWRIERMSINDLNIIRIATYEMMFGEMTQPSVFINEAVELAKSFGSDKSRNFVNGMLQQIFDDNKDKLNSL